MQRISFQFVKCFNFRNFRTFNTTKTLFAQIARSKKPNIENSNKIEINKRIISIQNFDEFKCYWKLNKMNFNLVNHTTYIRKFTDLMLKENLLKSEKQKLQEIMNEISLFLEQMQDNKSNDQQRDIARSYSMLISNCAEMYKHYNQSENTQLSDISDNNIFRDFALKVNNIIQTNEAFSDMNQFELANYFRGLIWLDLNEIVRANSKQIKRLDIAKFKLSNIIKLLHSCCNAEIQDIQTLQILLSEIIKKQRIYQLEYKDVESLFSFSYVIQPLPIEDYIKLIEVTAATIQYQNTQLTPKSIAIILNRLANLIQKIPQLSLQGSDLNNLINFCELQIKGKCHELHVKGLAHIINFYSRASEILKYKRELPFSEDELIEYTKTLEVNFDQLSMLLIPFVNQSLIKSKILFEIFLNLTRSVLGDKNEDLEQLIQLYNQTFDSNLISLQQKLHELILSETKLRMTNSTLENSKTN